MKFAQVLFSADLKHLQDVGGDDGAASTKEVNKSKAKKKVNDAKVTKGNKRKKKV